MVRASVVELLLLREPKITKSEINRAVLATIWDKGAARLIDLQ